jgi:BirA family biotin operon repressor/biotin-[acetyl-CoA-carboxylase] ligase
MWRVRTVAETGSTNTDLVALAHDGEPAGAVLVADHQSAGRGRLDRRWEAPPGAALLASVLLRPAAEEVGHLHVATQAVALAAREACVAVGGFRPALKWPNDLLVGEAKLAGILAEAAGGAVVVGIGLNLHPPVPPGAISADEAAGRRVERDDLLAALLDALSERVHQWHDHDAALAADYRAALATLGRAVRVERGPDALEGMAVDVTVDGRLVVEAADGRHLVSVGDVTHARYRDA